MANPKGHKETLRPLPKLGKVPLGKPIAVRLPQDLDEQVRAIPADRRQQFMRDAIAAALADRAKA